MFTKYPEEKKTFSYSPDRRETHTFPKKLEICVGFYFPWRLHFEEVAPRFLRKTFPHHKTGKRLSKKFTEKILGRRKSRKLQVSISPPRQQLHWQKMCACSCFGNLESPKCLQSPGEDLVGKVWFILLNFISYHSSSYLSPIPTHTNYVPALHTQLVRTRMDKKHPVLKVFGSGLSMLAASCHRGVDKKKKAVALVIASSLTIVRHPNTH